MLADRQIVKISLRIVAQLAWIMGSGSFSGPRRLEQEPFIIGIVEYDQPAPSLLPVKQPRTEELQDICCRVADTRCLELFKRTSNTLLEPCCTACVQPEYKGVWRCLSYSMSSLDRELRLATLV